MKKSTHWFKIFNVQIYTRHVVTFKLGRQLQQSAWFILSIIYSASVYRFEENPLSFPFLKERNISFLYSIIIQLSNSLWAMHQHSLWKLACFYLLEFQSVAFVAPHVPTQHIQNSPPATPKGTLQWKKQQLKMSIVSFAVYPAANYFLPNGSDHTFNPTNQILEYQQLII